MNKEYFYLGSSPKNILGNKINENQYDYFYNKETFDINNKMDSHAAVARVVKEESLVLDIGCASGNVGRILKDFKNCVVDGIEYDKTALDVAKSTNAYRDLYNISITDEDNKEYKKFFNKKIKYDYIIFADVIEHLVNPYEVIKTVSKLLKKDGVIVISLPNIAYIDTIRALMNGDFNYNNVGILDSTHLRFFTETSFVDMIENLSENDNINFNIELSDQIIVRPEYIKDQKIYEIFDLDDNINDFLTLQNIFKLTLVDNKNKIKKYETKVNKNYFSLINQKMIETNMKLERANQIIKSQKKEIKELKNDLKKCKESLDKLNIENNQNKEELNLILNSKIFKIINKFKSIR